MQDFLYHAPRSLPEALALLADRERLTKCLAGGTDLFLAMDRHRIQPAQVVDLKRIPELRGIRGSVTEGFTIGALTPMAEIVAHADLQAAYPALTDAAGYVGGPAIRNRATLGGNLCNASPAADTATPLLALGAELDVIGSGGKRSVRIADFWRGPGQTALGRDELLVAIRLPIRPERGGNAFQRVTRTAMDIAIANAAVDLAVDSAGKLTHIAIAIGAAGPTVLSVPGIEQSLRGKAIDAQALDWIAAQVTEAARPRDDVRGSAAYRKDQCSVLAKRAVRLAWQRATGREVTL